MLGAYVGHGVEHILLGFDHLLFVLALILIVREPRACCSWTITAFTLAHSITLALATLGVVHVPGPPVEAVDRAQHPAARGRDRAPAARRAGLTARWPWLVAFAFGLLHGFGFAGALTEVGLPQGDIPLALFAFNVGVELGQLAFIAVVLGVAAAARRVRVLAALERRTLPAVAYGIGILAAFRRPTGRARIVPPKGAPNVLLIITDDAGYGVPSTFGGVIPTPALDRIARDGLRYTNFHSTALCSPTRAALITGRNHHSVGFGVIAEQATGYPGYDSVITKDKATIGRILQGQRLPHVVVRQEPQHAGYQAARPVRSISGRPAWALSTSTASWAATPTSGSRATSSATPRRSIRSRATPATT